MYIVSVGSKSSLFLNCCRGFRKPILREGVLASNLKTLIWGASQRIRTSMTMHSFSTSRPVSCAFRTGKPSRCIAVRATCTSEKSEDANRRGVIQLAGAAVLSLALPKQAQSAAKTQATNVGSYLPPAEPGFSQFKPSETQTPVNCRLQRLIDIERAYHFSTCQDFLAGIAGKLRSQRLMSSRIQ